MTSHIQNKYNNLINKHVIHCNSLINNIYRSRNSIGFKISTINKIKDLSHIVNKTIQNKKVPERRSLHIGINYIGTPYELNGCINDANNLSNLIKSPMYGFNDKDILIISDNTDIKPTADNIIKNFINLMKNTQPGDVLFFSYSGHGVQVDKTKKNISDTSIVSSDLQIITDYNLKQLINEFLPPKVTLFALIDSCYSGTVLNLRYQYVDSLYNKENVKENETVGEVVMISGSRDDQTSADAPIYTTNADGTTTITYEGAMTWSFLSTMKSNPKPSWIQLITNMRTLLADPKNTYSQIPQLESGRPLNMENICSIVIIN